MDLNPVILSIPVFFILIGMEIGYDYFKNRKLYRLNDAVTNISCGIVEQLTGVFAKVFTVAAYVFVYNHFAIFELSDAWYWIVLCLIGVDFCYYWAHRMSHEVNLFWLGHVVHHQSEDYNLSVALRQSVFQKMFTFYFYFPLAILGFKPAWFLLAAAINLLYQFWIHTEVIKKMPRWFEAVFNTPSHHRVHHGRNPKYIDRNHAGSLIIWDKIFGTFQQEEEHPTYGITVPVNSWNPVMANIQPFILLFKELKTIPGFWDKLRFTFARPGWYPASMGGFRAPKNFDPGTYRKYEVTISPGLNFYLFGQYILVLAATALFLFTLSEFSFTLQILIAGMLILSVGTIGMLFENKQQAIRLELVRFLLSAALLGWLSWSGILPLWLFIGFLIAYILSVAVIFNLRFHQLSASG